MTYEHITLTLDGAYATVTMNRPERRNALSLAHMQELTHTFAHIGQTDALGITVAGNGPVFCAGHDFADMVGASLKDMRRLLRQCVLMMDTI